MQKVRNNDIYITKGDTLICILEITQADGTPYVAKPGDEIRFALKARWTDKSVAISKLIPHDTMILRLESEETKTLCPAQIYRYDIQVTMQDGTVDTIISGGFHVTEEVD